MRDSRVARGFLSPALLGMTVLGVPPSIRASQDSADSNHRPRINDLAMAAFGGLRRYWNSLDPNALGLKALGRETPALAVRREYTTFAEWDARPRILRFFGVRDQFLVPCARPRVVPATC